MPGIRNIQFFSAAARSVDMTNVEHIFSQPHLPRSSSAQPAFFLSSRGGSETLPFRISTPLSSVLSAAAAAAFGVKRKFRIQITWKTFLSNFSPTTPIQCLSLPMLAMMMTIPVVVYRVLSLFYDKRMEERSCEDKKIVNEQTRRRWNT